LEEEDEQYRRGIYWRYDWELYGWEHGIEYSQLQRCFYALEFGSMESFGLCTKRYSINPYCEL
jgi:hypothetical protein